MFNNVFSCNYFFSIILSLPPLMFLRIIYFFFLNIIIAISCFNSNCDNSQNSRSKFIRYILSEIFQTKIFLLYFYSIFIYNESTRNCGPFTQPEKHRLSCGIKFAIKIKLRLFLE